MIVLLVSTLLFSVSRAEESLLVREGGSVHLDVQGYEGLRFNTLYWHFNSKAILEYSIRFKHLTFYKDYKIRTEFDQKNFTLLLKNVQERDSGIYTAVIIDDEGKERDLASYRLTVQGVNIIVTATNGTIHCSSSNRVDTKTRSESTKTICAPVTPSSGLSPCELKSVLFSLGLVAMVSAVIAVNVRERCCRLIRTEREG